MIVPEIPANEAERLQALRALAILDTPPEERFDRVTRLAARLLGVPKAYVSLVDSDRQWFKSSVGMTTSETPREISFCGHAILGDDPMVVEDAAADPRFADNPLVTGDEGMRAYVGVPIEASGQKVGTFCVADRQAGRFTGEELQVLEDLAEIVQRECALVDVVNLQEKLLDTREKLVRSQQKLIDELAQAARYVRSRLPRPLDGEVRSDWLFVPSQDLGGDIFDHYWIDDDHLAVYLVDVSGHGVGSALLSISVMNVLRTRSLPGADVRQPEEVVAALNRAFPMHEHDNKYFTIWYGVYHRPSRELSYTSGGHPPAVLLADGDGDGAAQLQRLERPGLIVGAFPGTEYESATRTLEPGARLYVFSDGVYEVFGPDDSMLGLDGFLELLARSDQGGDGLEETLELVRAESGCEGFDDDVSLLRVRFD